MIQFVQNLRAIPFDHGRAFAINRHSDPLIPTIHKVQLLKTWRFFVGSIKLCRFPAAAEHKKFSRRSGCRNEFADQSPVTERDWQEQRETEQQHAAAWLHRLI